MANEKVRFITIHRTQKYDKQFVQMDYENIGAVFGKLTKTGAKNLYIYFMGNKDGYDGKLIASDYANWLGCPYARDGVIFDQSARAKITKQLREGIEQLKKEGYLVEKIEDTVFEFYEYGTKSSESDKKLDVEQKVTDEIKSSENNKKLQNNIVSIDEKKKETKDLIKGLMEQKVTQKTESSGFNFK